MAAAPAAGTPPNPIQGENAFPGATPATRLQPAYPPTSVEGYASELSVLPGEQVHPARQHGRGPPVPRRGLPARLVRRARRAPVGLALGPALAGNSAGGAIAVWDRETGPDCATAPASLTCIHTVEAVSRSGAGAPSGAPQPINRPGIGARPQAAIDDAGDATLLWVHDIGRDRVVQAAARPAGSSWGPATDVGSAGGAPGVAVDASGRAVAIWIEVTPGGTPLRSSLRAGGAAWSKPATVTPRNAADPKLGIDPAGNAVAVWTDLDLSDARAAVLPGAAGTWQPEVTISGGGGVATPSIAVDASGRAVVVWNRSLRPDWSWRAPTSPAAGSSR